MNGYNEYTEAKDQESLPRSGAKSLTWCKKLVFGVECGCPVPDSPRGWENHNEICHKQRNIPE